MLKIDSDAIKDKFASAQFSFYSDEEVEKLSVKEIQN